MKELAALARSPRKIRQSNEIAALRALMRAGRLSRADLARVLRLNRSSSGHIIAELTSAGLVREVQGERRPGAGYARAGRPGVLLELVPEAVFFLGAEIGVEHITTVLINLKAEIVRTLSEPFDGSRTSVEGAVERAVELALSGLPPEERARCEGFGISAPAQMDANGLVRLAPLLGWKDIDLVGLVRARLPMRVPVMAENDANAFAIGATYADQDAGSGVTLFMVLESGVGGGIVVDGKLLRGAHGLAGEIGHIHFPSDTGNGRNLEQIIGLESILSAYRQICPRPDPTFDDFLADVRDRASDAVAIAERWARALAQTLAQICRVIDPDRVVLGGSVAALYPLIAARIDAHIRACQEDSFPIPSIELNDDATSGSAYGAACMLHQRYLSFDSSRFGEAGRQD